MRLRVKVGGCVAQVGHVLPDVVQGGAGVIQILLCLQQRSVQFHQVGTDVGHCIVSRADVAGKRRKRVVQTVHIAEEPVQIPVKTALFTVNIFPDSVQLLKAVRGVVKS